MTEKIRIEERRGMVSIRLRSSLFHKLMKEMERIADGLSRGKMTKIRPILSKVKVTYGISLGKGKK